MIRRTVVAVLAAVTLLIGMTVSTALAARPVWVFTTQLTGEAERPHTGDLEAQGHATVAIFPESDMICWVVTWNRVDGTVVASHIHGPGNESVASPIVVPLFGPVTFGSFGMHRGCTVSVEWADAILADPGAFYVNVHSLPDFGPGAIRGQLD